VSCEIGKRVQGKRYKLADGTKRWWDFEERERERANKYLDTYD